VADQPDLFRGGLTCGVLALRSPWFGCTVDLVRTRRDDAGGRLSLDERLASSAWDDLSRRAADPEATPEELSELAEHHAWVVRAAVAVHPRVPRKTLEALRVDRAWGVRAAVRRRERG
jgi:hypothetical protein